MPRQPQKADLEAKKTTGMKATCLAISTKIPEVWLASKFESCDKLIRVTAWVQRAACNFIAMIQSRPANKDSQLTVEEVTAAELFLLRRS